MIRKRKIKRLGIAQCKGFTMNRYSGFEPVQSACRLALRRRPARIVSEKGMRGLRWYNITSKMRLMHQLKLREEWPRILRSARKSVPLKLRNSRSFLLY